MTDMCMLHSLPLALSLLNEPTHLDQLRVLALLSLEQRVLPQDRGGVEAHLRAFLRVLGHVRREALVEL